MSDQLPPMLTVEEAARLIRVGRTKAYAMAREWRTTGGRSGLPVVDFGNVLRVPRAALEELIGAELERASAEATRRRMTTPTSKPAGVAPLTEPRPNSASAKEERAATATATASVPRLPRHRRDSKGTNAQLDLFVASPS